MGVLRVTVLAFALAFALAALASACTGSLGSSGAISLPLADAIDPVVGAADRGADPAVVAVERDGVLLCAGVLVAADAVLTIRGCVGPPCDGGAPPAPESLSVRFGDGPSSPGPVSRVRGVAAAETGPSCEVSLALILLTTPIDGVQPLPIRATGAAQGDRVRTVAFDTGATGAAEKVVRDHVLVTATEPTYLELHESSCAPGCGRVVVDDAAEVVAVVAGPSIGADGSVEGDIAARADPFAPFVASVVGPNPVGSSSASRLRTLKGPVDMGSDCSGAIDCAASVCVSAGAKEYCSRSCDSVDRCPSRWRCEVTASASAPRVCVEI